MGAMPTLAVGMAHRNSNFVNQFGKIVTAARVKNDNKG